MMIFGIINKPENIFVYFHFSIFDGTFRNNSLIAAASLFSFQLRIKTPFHKFIMDGSVFFFTKVKYKGNIQITNTEETKKTSTSNQAYGCDH